MHNVIIHIVSGLEFRARRTRGTSRLHPFNAIDHACAALRASRSAQSSCCFQSCTSKGIGRQGTGSFCKEFLCFNTTPCRPTPLLVHS